MLATHPVVVVEDDNDNDDHAATPTPGAAKKEKEGRIEHRPNDPCAWVENAVQKPNGISTHWQGFVPKISEALRFCETYVCAVPAAH